MVDPAPETLVLSQFCDVAFGEFLKNSPIFAYYASSPLMLCHIFLFSLFSLFFFPIGEVDPGPSIDSDAYFFHQLMRSFIASRSLIPYLFYVYILLHSCANCYLKRNYSGTNWVPKARKKW